MRESMTTFVMRSGRMLPFHGKAWSQSASVSVHLDVSVTVSVRVEPETLH